MSTTADLRRLQADPALFRRALRIDCDGKPRRLAEVLDDWQADDFAALDPAWQRAVGQRVEAGCNRAYLERCRGASKTTDLAAMVAWALFASKRRIVGIAAAADKDQAALLRNAVDGLLRLNPWLGEILEVQSYRVFNRRTGSELTVISNDAPSSYGALVDFIVVDELTHWKSEDLWTSLFSTAAKRQNCLLVIISNAGFGKGDSWQWRVREAARTSPGWHFNRLDKPPSWIGPETLDEQRRILPKLAYQRLWLNQWTTGSGDALEADDIDRAIRLKGPIRRGKRGWRFVAGLDLGLRRDASALVVVGQHVGFYEEHELPLVLSDRQRMLVEAGVIEEPQPEYDVQQVEGTGKLRVASVDVWEPGRNRVSIEEIEARILELDEAFRLDCIAVDIWQAAQLAERLNKHGIPTEGIDFTPNNLKAMATGILEGFQEGRIELYDHPKLVADLRSLRVVEKSYGIRLEPGQSQSGTKHGDAGTALALSLLAEGRSQGHRPQTVNRQIIAA